MLKLKSWTYCICPHVQSVILLLSIFSNLVVNGQNTGTAVQLQDVDTIDTVQARIKAELDNEEQSRRHTQNVVRLAATDQLNSEIITNRTRAYLSCESGEMIVKINFTEPFRGVGYSDYDRTSPCKFYGDGGRYYELRLPLKGCGTKQEAPRIFINNIILRFHRSLELEEDEIKTIICRYPPPLAPPPPYIAAPILESPPPPVPFMPAKLSEVELLLIVSALLFLTLLLLGIGIGYYCLKRRNIKVVRKIPPPSPPSYISDVSDEHRSILSETSTIHRDHFRYENLGYIPEHKLFAYDDLYRTNHHLIDEDVDIIRQNVIAPPLPLVNTHKVDDWYVTNASLTDIDEDLETGRIIAPKRPKITTIITDDYYVTPTTTTEIIEDIVTQKVIVPPAKPLTSKYVDNTLITPQITTEVDESVTKHKKFGPKKPVVTKQSIDDHFIHPETDTEVVEDVTTQRFYSPHRPVPKTAHKDTYYRDVYEIDEILDESVTDLRVGPQPTTRTIQTSEDEYVTTSRDVDEFIDDTSHKVLVSRKPTITVKDIHDFYVTNISETETREHIIRTGQSLPNLLLGVDYDTDDEEPDKNARTHTGFDVTMRSVPLKLPNQTVTDTVTTSTVTEATHFDAILHVIDNPPKDKIPNVEKHFPEPQRDKLRTVILTDEVFRTLIIESTTIEEYTERIQHHQTYGPMFDTPTWEIIFRILSLPEVANSKPKEPNKKQPIDSIRSYKSGYSAHEMRSVTEEDVSFSRHRLTSSHYVPMPDYPIEEGEIIPSWSSPKKLPDPKPYSHDDFSPLKPIFPSSRKPRQRIAPETHTTSSVFGQRHLANPYDPYKSASPSIRRRLMEYGQRPYSPDLDALSLEPSQSIRSKATFAYTSVGSTSSKHQQQQQHARQRISDEHEEIKSTTETDIYDWKRYS